MQYLVVMYVVCCIRGAHWSQAPCRIVVAPGGMWASDTVNSRARLASMLGKQKCFTDFVLTPPF